IGTIDPVTGQVGLIADEQFVLNRFALTRDLLLRADEVRLWRHQPGENLVAVWMNEAELQLRDLLQLFASLLELRGVEARDLDKDAVRAGRRDDRFARSHRVHTLANRFDRLVDQLGRNLALGAIFLLLGN